MLTSVRAQHGATNTHTHKEKQITWHQNIENFVQNGAHLCVCVCVIELQNIEYLYLSYLRIAKQFTMRKMGEIHNIYFSCQKSDTKHFVGSATYTYAQKVDFSANAINQTSTKIRIKAQEIDEFINYIANNSNCETDKIHSKM
jgi:hypothetical protein